MNPAKLRQRVEVWHRAPFVNELGENDYEYVFLKKLWAEVVPQTGSLQKQQANTVLSNVSHKIIVRYQSGKDITQNMYLMYNGHRFDIKYILNPYFKNETLELFCEEVIR